MYKIYLLVDDRNRAYKVDKTMHDDDQEKNYKSDNVNFNQEFNAACAELAAAKYLDMEDEWNCESGSLKMADIGTNIQVRHSMSNSYANGLSLIYRIGKNDNPRHIYIPVTGAGCYFFICGWMYGIHAFEYRLGKPTRGKKDIYTIVPYSCVNPLDTLNVEEVDDDNHFWNMVDQKIIESEKWFTKKL